MYMALSSVCTNWQPIARASITWRNRAKTQTGSTAQKSKGEIIHIMIIPMLTHFFILYIYLIVLFHFQTQLNEKHILRIPVRWVDGGLNLDLPDHAQYVTEVTSQLGKHFRALVDNIIEEDQAKVSAIYGIITDTKTAICSSFAMAFAFTIS